MTGTLRTGLDLALGEVLAAVDDHAPGADDGAVFPVQALDAMRSTGLLGLCVPAEHGGGGGTLADLVDVTVELARHDMSVAMIFAMHCQQVLTVVRHAEEPLRDRLLGELAPGRHYLASVTTERGKGGHLLSSESETSIAADRLVIDRDAPIVTGGLHADGFLITVLTPEAISPAQVSLVYADRADLQIAELGGWQPLGMRATQSVPMRLTGSVPAGQVIGAAGGFHDIVARTFGPLAHLGWSAAWLGTATGALSRVLQYLRSDSGRKQYDVSSELLLTRIARVRSRLETVNALLQQAIRCWEEYPDLSGAPAQLLINTLKIQAAEQCFAAADELMELAGLRLGYLRDSPLQLERVFRDLRSASLNYGNDRLYLVNGALALRDRQVHFA
ncbi:MAG TPA: acyl-CoA dehydrogenase family protein [Jatrophihabitans sp.]|nr:acyl-CoA dehydrogenase family protein [Jatrophihabitans sp.]